MITTTTQTKTQEEHQPSKPQQPRVPVRDGPPSSPNEWRWWNVFICCIGECNVSLTLPERQCQTRLSASKLVVVVVVIVSLRSRERDRSNTNTPLTTSRSSPVPPRRRLHHHPHAMQKTGTAKLHSSAAFPGLPHRAKTMARPSTRLPPWKCQQQLR